MTEKLSARMEAVFNWNTLLFLWTIAAVSSDYCLHAQNINLNKSAGLSQAFILVSLILDS